MLLFCFKIGKYVKFSGELGLAGVGGCTIVFKKFKIRPSLLSPNRGKTPFKFYLFGLKCPEIIFLFYLL